LSSAQIEDGTVDTADLATNAVTTAKITAGNVTTAKIADANVTTAKLAASSALIGKNLIINGEHRVAQRGTSGALAASPVFTCDRWRWGQSSGTSGTMEQSTTVPSGVGYVNSLRFNPGNAQTPGTAEFNIIGQRIEAQNLGHLLYGNSAAKTLTLQFYVRSPKTGTHTFAAYQNDKSGGRCYVGTYTVAVADTFEKITTTIAGDTGGQIDNDNGNGFDIIWNIGSGSDYETSTINEWQAASAFLYSTSGAAFVTDDAAKDFFIAGVQLEVGSVATDFEFEPISVTLAKSQRYFVRLNDLDEGMPFMAGQAITATRTRAVLHLPVTMRNTALGGITVALSDAANHFSARAVNVAKAASGITAQSSAGGNVISLDLTIASTTAGDAILHESDTSNAYVDFSSEL